MDVYVVRSTDKVQYCTVSDVLNVGRVLEQSTATAHAQKEGERVYE